MIDKNIENLSISSQCKLVGVSRSSYYYKPKNKQNNDLFIKDSIMKIHSTLEFYGVRRKKIQLLNEFNINVNHKKISRLIKEHGIITIYPKRKLNLSKPHPENKIYPYLLRGVNITRVNQVWSTDITYIRLRHGMAYFAAVIDWKSRMILSWQLSNTLDKEFCISAVEDAIIKYGKPEIFNSDQGSQFTSKKFIKLLNENNIQISMSGKGRAFDNILIERFWRSLKQENIYLNDYENMQELRKGISEYIKFYNERRFHQSLNYKTPQSVYYKEMEMKKNAVIREKLLIKSGGS